MGGNELELTMTADGYAVVAGVSQSVSSTGVGFFYSKTTLGLVSLCGTGLKSGAHSLHDTVSSFGEHIFPYDLLINHTVVRSFHEQAAVPKNRRAIASVLLTLGVAGTAQAELI